MKPRADFRVVMMHHATCYVPDLDEAAGWMGRIFKRPGTSITKVLAAVPYVRSDWPRDYSIYTSISDVFFNAVDPGRIVVDGKHLRKPVDTPHLKDFGWAVDGQAETFRRLRSDGTRLVNSLGETLDGDTPTGPNDPAPFYTLPGDMGLRYHFYPSGRFPADARTESGWEVPPVSDSDPLGIERCSHHTVLTKQPGRALALYVDGLGADIIREGRNEASGASSTYLHLGGTTLEYADPDDGSAAHDDWALKAPEDTYHSITWKVADLERAWRHLERHGVRIGVSTSDTIVTDPMTSLGIPWGFTTKLVPGDPRGEQVTRPQA